MEKLYSQKSTTLNPYILLVFCLLCLVIDAFSQGVGINNDGSMPDANTMLDIKSLTDDNTSYSIKIKNNSGTAIMVVRSEGNVGIGTSTPESRLEISNITDNNNFIYSTTGANGRFSLGTDASANVLFRTYNNVDLRMGVGTADDMVIKNGGNVGIGILTPDYGLHLHNAGAATGMFNVSGTGSGYTHAATLMTSTNDYRGAGHYMEITESGQEATWYTGTPYSGTGNFQLGYFANDFAAGGNAAADDGNAVMTATEAGNVGIGTTNPGEILDVNGDLRVRGSGGTIGGSNIANGYLLIGSGSSGIGIDNNEMYFNGLDANFGVLSANNLNIRTAGSLAMHISGTNQNIGIGNNSPAYKLDVTGTAHVDGLNVNGAYSLPTADGTNTYVLATNGSGAVTWTDPNTLVSGDITGVTAGDGLTGGGSSGALTLNVVARNGLTDNANDIELGGTLDENTTITQAGFNMTYDLNGTGDFQITDGGSTRMIVQDAGNIGIGTASPGAKLDIDQDASANALRVLGGNGGSNMALFKRDIGTDGQIYFNASGGDPQMRFDPEGGGTTFSIGIDDSDSDKLKIGTGAVASSTELTIQTDGNVGIGTTTPSTKLYIYKTYTSDANVTGTENYTRNTATLTGNRYVRGIRSVVLNRQDENGNHSYGYGMEGVAYTDGTYTFNSLRGGNFSAYTNSTAASGQDNMYGIVANGYLNSSGTASNVYGSLNQGYNNNTGTVNAANGAYNLAFVNNSGDIGTAYGSRNYVYKNTNGTGNITTAYGTHSRVRNSNTSGVGNITNAYAYYGLIDKHASGLDHGTSYGMRLNVNAGGTRYGIYTENEGRNYFSANVGIGVTSPSQELHVAGGARVTDLGGSGTRMVVTDNNGVLSQQAIPTGDITDVTAGDGLTGGGSSGALTLNVVARNGLTDNANDIELGGTLDENTTITQAGFNMDFNLTGAGDFAVQNSGTDALFVEGGTGNVGIGSATPSEKLDVQGNVFIDPAQNGEPALEISGSDGGYEGLLIDMDNDFGSNNTYALKIRTDDGATHDDTDTKFIVQVDGNVGIGNATPGQTLHVTGNSLVTGNTYIGSTDSYFYRDAANRIATPDQFYVQNSSANTYLYSTNTYLGSPTGDAIHLRGNYFDWTGGTGGIISTDGNIGIGNTSPSEKLHVTGNTRITGLGGSGTRMVVTDNNGVLSQQAIPTGDITNVTAGTGMVGGGSSGSVTLDVIGANGISAAADQVILGGQLTQSTFIESPAGQNYSMVFDLNGNGDFRVRDGGTMVFEVNANSHTYIGGTSTGGSDLYISDRLIDWDNTGYYIDPNGTNRINEVHGDDGSQTDPSFTFGGDANTGIFRPGTDQVSITTGGGEKVRVLANGNVGIGTTAPTQKLEVNGRVKSNGINETSDARLKKNITSLDNSLEKIMSLRGVSYKWKSPKELEKENIDPTLSPNAKRVEIGLIAQELEEVFPELVDTDNDGYKSVQYSKVVAVLIEAVKDQQKTINSLKAENNSQTDLYKKQQEELNEIKASLGIESKK